MIRANGNVIKPKSDEELAAIRYELCLQERQTYYKWEVFKIIAIALPIVMFYFHQKNPTKNLLALLVLSFAPLAYLFVIPVWATIRTANFDYLLESSVRNIPFVGRAPKCVNPNNQ